MPINNIQNKIEHMLINGIANGNECHDSKRTSWNVKTSTFSLKTRNHIRDVAESLNLKPNVNKEMIRLTIGDPTTFGNLRASPESVKAMVAAVKSEQHNGYAHLQGQEAARKAIAVYSAHQSLTPIPIENIFITNGCATALEYCILSLAESGKNILVPRPGYTLYNTQTEGFNIELRYYDLLPEQDWQADLKQLESLIDENTAALLVNNPSNPCGSVFSKQHLEDMIAICEKHYLPIIADEIYEHMVFPGKKHIALSSLSKNVPVLTCSGLTKRFVVPGWRIGWVIAHDRENRLNDIMLGLRNMSGRVLGSSNLIQGALPDILQNTPQSFFEDVMKVIASNAKLTFKLISKIPGLHPVMPSGAMYMMIGIDFAHFPHFKDDNQFVEALVNEQSVFCLPGSCCLYPYYVRFVLTVPGDMIEEACARMSEFCKSHYDGGFKSKQESLLRNSVEYDHCNKRTEKNV